MLCEKKRIRDLPMMGKNRSYCVLWRNARMTPGRCHGQFNVDGTFLCDGWKSDHRAKRLLESRYRSCVVGPALVHIKWKKNHTTLINDERKGLFTKGRQQILGNLSSALFRIRNGFSARKEGTHAHAIRFFVESKC